MDKSICFLIQARVGSTRLPKKMILPFYEGKNILELIIEKLKFNFPNIPIIVATSTNSENNVLEQITKKKGGQIYRGDENDVLKRFVDAAIHFNCKSIIRVCADNPFLDVNEILRLITYTEQNHGFDYVSFTVNGSPSIRTHFGFWTEFVTLETLQDVNTRTNDTFYHEHVTNFIYQNPSDFKINFLPVNQILEGKKDVRMTLDTLIDFEILSKIYKALYLKYGNQFGINEIVSFLDENPDYKAAMKEQITINSK